MKIAFLGTPHFAEVILSGLIKSPYKPQLVITAPDQKVGRGQILSPSPVKATAVENGIEVRHLLFGKEDQIDLAILVAYGKIIPQEILKLPKFGFVNVHPSLLPKYRGPSPIQSAILNGEKETGVSVMLLDEKLDHGPILAQKKVAIEASDSHTTLAQKLALLGAKLLLESLPKYQLGEIKAEAQENSKATYTEKISRDSGKIDLDSPPGIKKLSLMVRAFYPWPGVWFEVEEKRFKLMPDNKIQPEGKAPMTKTDLLNGYPNLKSELEKIGL